MLDAVGYGAFGAGDVFAGEGSPAADPAAGSSIARWLADVDSDDNALDFTVLDVPTPGTAPVSVPEPGTGMLTATALAAGLLLTRRGPTAGRRRGDGPSPPGRWPVGSFARDTLSRTP